MQREQSTVECTYICPNGSGGRDLGTPKSLFHTWLQLLLQPQIYQSSSQCVEVSPRKLIPAGIRPSLSSLSLQHIEPPKPVLVIVMGVRLSCHAPTHTRASGSEPRQLTAEPTALYSLRKAAGNTWAARTWARPRGCSALCTALSFCIAHITLQAEKEDQGGVHRKCRTSFSPTSITISVMHWAFTRGLWQLLSLFFVVTDSQLL